MFSNLPLATSYKNCCFHTCGNSSSAFEAIMSRLEVAHRFFAKYILAAQFFGVFPVSGITNLNHNKLKFKWCSFTTCYSLLMICLALINGYIEMYYKMFSPSKTNLAKMSKKLFLVCVVKI